MSAFGSKVGGLRDGIGKMVMSKGDGLRFELARRRLDQLTEGT